MSQQTNKENENISLILGIISLIAWFFPLFGFPISIIGLSKSIKKNNNQLDFSKIDILLNSLGLLLTVINSAIGAYLGANR